MGLDLFQGEFDTFFFREHENGLEVVIKVAEILDRVSVENRLFELGSRFGIGLEEGRKFGFHRGNVRRIVLRWLMLLAIAFSMLGLRSVMA